MKLIKIILLALFATSLVSVEPAAALPRPADLFSPDVVSEITITISDKSAISLAKAPKTSVGAKFSISSAAGIKAQDLPVDFHLKGTSTLRQNPSLTASRPSLRVKFKRDGPLKLGFLGSLKSLTLNSMTQDASKIHEYSAYKLYNAMNVPAPRVGYAKVKVVIGSRVYDKGLFAVIEPYDDVFLNARFSDRSKHLFEPCDHWTDVTRVGAASGGEDCGNALFEVKEGWKKYPNKDDLKALAEVQKLKNHEEWWAAMGRYTDRNEFIRMWAVENFISAWDSYSGSIINNYYLRSNSLGVFTMMPTGADETFVYNFSMDSRSIGYPLIQRDFNISAKNRGFMFTRCLTYKPCLNQYISELQATKETAEAIDLVGQMKLVSKTASAGSPGMQQLAQSWIAMKGKEVDALVRKYKP